MKRTCFIAYIILSKSEGSIESYDRKTVINKSGKEGPDPRIALHSSVFPEAQKNVRVVERANHVERKRGKRKKIEMNERNCKKVSIVSLIRTIFFYRAFNRNFSYYELFCIRTSRRSGTLLA